ncbi:hypothetical protein Tco_0076677, partial [Tanacetum coccineum]
YCDCWTETRGDNTVSCPHRSPVSSRKSTIQVSFRSDNGLTSSELEARVCIQIELLDTDFKERF